MNNFKVGDLVRTTKEYLRNYGRDYYYEGKVIKVITQTLSPDERYCVILLDKRYGGYEKGENIAIHPRYLELAVLKSKEEQLVDKINQLYEKQQWVKDNRPEATYYTNQLAQSAEKRAKIRLETISAPTPMDTFTVSSVDTSLANNYTVGPDWITINPEEWVIQDGITGRIQFPRLPTTGLRNTNSR